MSHFRLNRSVLMETNCHFYSEYVVMIGLMTIGQETLCKKLLILQCFPEAGDEDQSDMAKKYFWFVTSTNWLEGLKIVLSLRFFLLSLPSMFRYPFFAFPSVWTGLSHSDKMALLCFVSSIISFSSRVGSSSFIEYWFLTLSSAIGVKCCGHASNNNRQLWEIQIGLDDDPFSYFPPFLRTMWRGCESTI